MTDASTTTTIHLQPTAAERSPRASLTKWAIFLVLLIAVGYTLVRQASKLDWAMLHFDALPLVAAAVALFVVYAARSISFRILLDGYGAHITWRQAAVVGWLPQIAKYIPGQVWSIGGAVKLLRDFAVPGPVALAVVLVMDGLAVLTGLMTGAPLLLWHPILRRYPHAWIWCALLVVGGLTCLHPRMYGWLLNVALKKLKRAPIQSLPPWHDYIGPVLLGFTQWLLAGGALWLIAGSITFVDWRTLHLYVAIAGLGYTAGYLSPFPGGLGPRDAIFQLLLTLLLPNAVAASVIVIAMRLLQTAVEVVMAVAGWVLLKRQGDKVSG